MALASIFISHSSADNETADRLRRFLLSDGFQSVFLDFDPEAGIPPGRDWEAELYSELRKADVVIFLSTQAAVSSKWCHAELVLARALGRVVVPVLLEPGAAHPLVRDTQWISDPSGDGRVFPRVAEAVRQITSRVDPGWDVTRSPYPGLHPFDETRAGVFFGRDAEIEELLNRVTWPHAEGAERLVLVVGSSGSGKSSLVRAGVLPRVRLLEGPWVVIPTFAPRDVAFEQLAASLLKAFDEFGEGTESVEALALRLRNGALPALIRELCRAADISDGGRGGVVATIDQAEQLTTDSAHERTAFLDAIAAAVDASAPIRVIATLREEYLSRVVAGTAFAGRASSTLPIGRLSPERLGEVIEKPADRAGIAFEPGLVQRIVEDTRSGAPSGGDPLPLLAFTLEQVFEKRVERTRITSEDYDRVGGVTGALRAEADRVYRRLAERGRGDVIVPALLELVNAEADEPDPTGRNARREQFDAVEWEVIQAFVDARLLTTEGEGPTVAVAHEALLRDWPVLESEIRRSRDKLIARSRLDRDAREWNVAGRRQTDLLSGPRLKTARRALASEPAATVDSVVRDFVQASQRQARRSRALVALVAAAGVLTAVAIAASAWYTVDWLRERARKADARAAFVRVGERATAFSVDEHEVTYEQYRLCVLEGRCAPPPKSNVGPDFDRAPATDPVVYLGAPEADAFCRWIGRRVPTLDELQRAARVGSVRHLLDGLTAPGDPNTLIGGREWTSSPNRAILGRDPQTGETYTDFVDPSRAELDLGFRCAES